MAIVYIDAYSLPNAILSHCEISVLFYGIRNLLSHQWFVKPAVVYSSATRKNEVVAQLATIKDFILSSTGM